MKHDRQRAPLLAATALLLAGLCVGYAAADAPDQSGSELVGISPVDEREEPVKRNHMNLDLNVRNITFELGMDYQLRVECIVDPELEAPAMGGPTLLPDVSVTIIGAGECVWEAFYAQVSLDKENVFHFSARGRLDVVDSASRAKEYQAAGFTMSKDAENVTHYTKVLSVEQTMEREG